MARADAAWVDVLPSLEKFTPELKKALGGVMPAAGRQAGDEYARGFTKQAVSGVESASRQLAAARKKEADAAGAVRVAEARLQDLRESGKAKTAQLVAAEENLAKSKRNLDVQTDAVTRSTMELATAEQQATRGAQRLDDSLDRAGKSSTQMGRSVGTLSAGLKTGIGFLVGGGIIAGLGSVARGIKSVVGSASDLNETVNKSNVIFGDNAERIERWADGASKNFGLSKQAALEAASSFGNMFQQLGFSGDAATDASTRVVQLAADLGSFNNLETGDVLERLAAGFRGEYDSLQLLIPNINAARVESEAMAETGKDNADALTAQEKAAAVLAIVQKDGAAANNDFAETADGLANSTKSAAAQFEDLKSRIGQDLLPVAQDAMHFFSSTALPVLEDVYGVTKALVGGFADLPGPMQAAVVAAGGWAVAGGRITGTLGGVRDKVRAFREEQALQQALFAQQRNTISDVDRALGGLGTTVDKTGARFGRARTAIGGFVRAIGPELAAAGAAYVIGSAASSLEKIAHAGDDARHEVDDLNDSLSDIEGNAPRIDATARAIEDLRGKLAAAKAEQPDGGDFAGSLGSPLLLGETTAAYKDAAASAREYERAIEELEGQQRHTDAAAAELATRLGVSKSEAIDLADKYDVDLSGSLDNVYGRFLLARASVEGTEGAMDNANSTTGKFAAEMEAVADAADAAQEQTDQFKLSLDILTGAHVSLLQVESAFQQALSAASDAVQKEGGAVLDAAGALNTHTENGRAASDVLIDIKDSGNQLIATMIQQGATTEEVVAKDRELRESFIQSAMQMGISRQAAENLADQILGIPSERETKIKADTAQANAAIADTQTRIDNLHGKTVTVSVRADGTVAAILGDASRNISPFINTGFAEGGYTGDGPKYRPAGLVHAGEYVVTKERTARLGVRNLENLERILPGYAAGGIVVNFDPNPLVSTVRAVMDRVQEPATAGARALAFARSQVGKPYIWGGVGPAGYDCSGFMSALANVARGHSPYRRLGSTATFPWPGFAPGYGFFTIGSTPNAGGGIGHMAGTLLGVNVESTGGVGVRVGPSARGASSGLFSERGHLVFDSGGLWPPGWGFNGTGDVERVLTPEHDTYFRRLIDVTDRITGGEAGPTYVTQVSTPFDGRKIAAAVQDSQRTHEFLYG